MQRVSGPARRQQDEHGAEQRRGPEGHRAEIPLHGGRRSHHGAMVPPWASGRAIAAVPSGTGGVLWPGGGARPPCTRATNIVRGDRAASTSGLGSRPAPAGRIFSRSGRDPILQAGHRSHQPFGEREHDEDEEDAEDQPVVQGEAEGDLIEAATASAPRTGPRKCRLPPSTVATMSCAERTQSS